MFCNASRIRIYVESCGVPVDSQESVLLLIVRMFMFYSLVLCVLTVTVF